METHKMPFSIRYDFCILIFLKKKIFFLKKNIFKKIWYFENFDLFKIFEKLDDDDNDDDDVDDDNCNSL